MDAPTSNRDMPYDQASIVSIPKDLLIEILARVGSFCPEDLDRTKCTSRALRRIGDDPEVYRLARIRDEHIVAIFDREWRLPAREDRFVTKCVNSRNPFKEYALAVYNLVEKEDVEAALLHLDKATKTAAITYPAAYLKCVCLLYSSNSDHRSAGLELLHTLKSRGKLDECRSSFIAILSEMRWHGYRGMINCRRTAPLCPERSDESSGCPSCGSDL